MLSAPLADGGREEVGDDRMLVLDVSRDTI